eukprot:138402-Amphidinium_carterae.1
MSACGTQPLPPCWRWHDFAVQHCQSSNSVVVSLTRLWRLELDFEVLHSLERYGGLAGGLPPSRPCHQILAQPACPLAPSVSGSPCNALRGTGHNHPLIAFVGGGRVDNLLWDAAACARCYIT